jgi:hypothetical protein
MHSALRRQRPRRLVRRRGPSWCKSVTRSHPQKFASGLAGVSALIGRETYSARQAGPERPVDGNGRLRSREAGEKEGWARASGQPYFRRRCKHNNCGPGLGVDRIGIVPLWPQAWRPRKSGPDDTQQKDQTKRHVAGSQEDGGRAYGQGVQQVATGGTLIERRHLLLL